jgi:hypothetical protein
MAWCLVKHKDFTFTFTFYLPQNILFSAFAEEKSTMTSQSTSNSPVGVNSALTTLT